MINVNFKNKNQINFAKKTNIKTIDIIYTHYDQQRDWMSKLKFDQDKILIFKNRLSKIVSKNTQKDILAQAKHFQNQLIVQK